MKKILMVHPNNVLQGKMGANNRAIQVIKMLNELGYTVDFFSYDHYTPVSSFDDFETLNKDHLIHELFLYDFENERILRKKETILKKVIRKCDHWIHPAKNPKYHLQDWTTPNIVKYFHQIVEENDYDYIILFYAYFSALVENITSKTTKVLYFMEDSLFLQQYSMVKADRYHPSLGQLLDSELEKFRYFDRVFCISYDEKIMYEKFLGRSVTFFPHVLPKDSHSFHKPIDERKWDIYFIGFNNPFNVEGLRWFIKEVYPLLSKNIKIVLVGSAATQLNINYKNIEVLPSVDNVNEVLEDAKVCICPMFQGTGMKVKVVEAMSKGLPVVCNDRGVDGMPDKTECGCLVTQESKQFAAYISKLLSDHEYYEAVSNKILKYYKEIFDYDMNLGILKNGVENF